MSATVSAGTPTQRTQGDTYFPATNGLEREAGHSETSGAEIETMPTILYIFIGPCLDKRPISTCTLALAQRPRGVTI
jgi:hypothetical protein